MGDVSVLALMLWAANPSNPFVPLTVIFSECYREEYTGRDSSVVDQPVPKQCQPNPNKRDS
jgi:hypothetical protein